MFPMKYDWIEKKTKKLTQAIYRRRHNMIDDAKGK